MEFKSFLEEIRGDENISFVQKRQLEANIPKQNMKTIALVHKMLLSSDWLKTKNENFLKVNE